MTWQEQAACIGDEDDPTADNAAQKRAFIGRNCVRCPVIDECFNAYLGVGKVGIWGGVVWHGGVPKSWLMRDKINDLRDKCDHDVRRHIDRVKVRAHGKQRDIVHTLACLECERIEREEIRNARLPERP